MRLRLRQQEDVKGGGGMLDRRVPEGVDGNKRGESGDSGQRVI